MRNNGTKEKKAILEIRSKYGFFREIGQVFQMLLSQAII
jgi:hypothetical protein